MARQNPAVLIDHHALTCGLGRAPRDKRRIVVVGNEADLVAVWLVCDRQLVEPRELAHGSLLVVADWKHRARELRLCERKQEVRLVLGRVCASQEEITAARLFSGQARVVARGDRVGAKPAGPVEQRRELEVAVAMGAG